MTTDKRGNVLLRSLFCIHGQRETQAVLTVVGVAAVTTTNLETYNGKSFPNSSGGQKPKIKEALGEIHILTSSRFRWLLAFLACGRTPPISSSCGHIAFSSVCVKSAFASLLRGYWDCT